jgi:DNA-binding response OmpR family regulator
MATILLVENDAEFRVWLWGLLSAKGYHVVEAPDGRDALSCIDHEQPELVVLDLYLPGLRGFDVIMQLRKRVPSVKVLVISDTAIDRYNDCDTAKLLGAHEVMTRPFGAESFLRCVASLLVHP